MTEVAYLLGWPCQLPWVTEGRKMPRAPKGVHQSSWMERGHAWTSPAHQKLLTWSCIWVIIFPNAGKYMFLENLESEHGGQSLPLLSFLLHAVMLLGQLIIALFQYIGSSRTAVVI